MCFPVVQPSWAKNVLKSEVFFSTTAPVFHPLNYHRKTSEIKSYNHLSPKVQ